MAGRCRNTVTPTSGTTYTASFQDAVFADDERGGGRGGESGQQLLRAAQSVSTVRLRAVGYSFTGWTAAVRGPTAGGAIGQCGDEWPITETAAFTTTPAVTVQTSPSGRPSQWTG